MREDLRLQIDTTKSPETHQEIILFEFAQFCAWAMELIQNKEIPLGVALSTCLYLSIDLREILKKGDYDELWERIDGVSALITEFMALHKECSQSFNIVIWEKISEIVENVYCDALQKDKADKNVITEIQPYFLAEDNRKVFLLKNLYDIWKEDFSEDTEFFLRRFWAGNILIYLKQYVFLPV